MFDPQEGGQSRCRDTQREHRAARIPAVLAGGDQAVGQRAQPDHAQHLAGGIEGGMFGMGAFLDAPQAQPDGQRADRQVDQEDALPVEVRDQHAAQHGSHDQRDRVAGRPESDGLRAFPGVRKGLRQQ
ncbi:hypothetical protein D3C87_1497760 [compost metagenome]